MLAIDSGAFSLHNKYAARGRSLEHTDFGFYETQKFTKYLEDYLVWLKTNAPYLSFCTTLDILYNPELTLAIWKEMCIELKQDLIPVYHFGEPFIFLKKMASQTGYIGIGGLGKGITRKQYIPFITEVFKYLGSTKEVKTHGFALTSPSLVLSFPWYSVDSTTPFFAAKSSEIIVGHGNRFFRFTCGDRPVTIRANHFHVIPNSFQAKVHLHLEQAGLTYADISGDNWKNRALINYISVANLCAEANVRYYVSGCVGDATTLTHIQKKVPDFNYLGSFYFPKYIEALIKRKKIRGNQTTIISPKGISPGTPKPRLYSSADSLLLQGK